MADTVFLRLLADDDKQAALTDAIASLHDPSSLNSAIYTVNCDSFRQVPGSQFAYWVSDRIHQLFTKLPLFESDRNDGVVLNIAPLWELVPWNEAKKYWQELTAGKYEWSSIGKQLQARGVVKC